MKTKSFSFCVIVSAMGLLLFAGLGWAQDSKPAQPEEPPKKEGGLLGVFSGPDDPTEDRRPSQPADSGADTKGEKKVDTPIPAGPPVVHAPPDPDRLDKHIRRLEGLNYDNLKPVSGLDEAKERINRLRRRAAELQFRADERTVKTVKAIAERGKSMEDKWMELIKAMKDGKKRTLEDWANLAKGMLGAPDEPKLPAVLDAGDIADEAVGLPTPKDLAFKDVPDEGEMPPTDDEVDPLKPIETPKPETKVPPPDLTDLIKAIQDQAKPETMHPLTWARLMDRFGQDLAEFRAAYAAAMKQLKDQRQEEFDPVAAALRAAQRTYSDLKKLGEPGKAMRRHLAYRLHQAELAQLRLARNDLRQLAEERKGQKSNRPLSIRTDPMAPENTLIDLARMMEVGGRPGAPSENAFNNLSAEGLPNLYPPGSGTIIDNQLHYGNLVKANIDRYQRTLRDIHGRMANADKLVKRRERKVLRRRAAELRREDRLAGREGHPLNEARNRLALRKLQQELRASREEHIKQLKAKLQQEAQGIVKRLEAEYKHRDAVLEAEKDSKLKTKEGKTTD